VGAGAGRGGGGAAAAALGRALAPAACGRGLAREGAAAIRDEAFAAVGVSSLVARIQPANERSIAVARAAGLTYEFSTTGRSSEPVAVHRFTGSA